MSNEFLMVPRELTPEMRKAYEEHSLAPVGPISKTGYLAMLDASPAQHQGEPVVSQCPLCCQTHEQVPVGRAGGQQANGCDVDFTTWRCEGCGGSWTGDPADPGEVERLREELKTAIQGSVKEDVFDIVCKERDTLRAQLAERDALLDRVVDHANFWHDHPYAEVVEAIAKDYKALSASAEPSAPECGKCGSLNVDACIANGCWFQQEQSAPVERDERAEFDSWFRKEKGLHPETDTTFIDSAFLPYRAWKARATLERKP